MRQAFTLIELMIVIAVIGIASAIAAPTIQGLQLHAQRAQAMQLFGGAVTAAQTEARAHFTTVALRVERAFETDADGQLLTHTDGTARWRNHQQLRLLASGRRHVSNPLAGEEFSFRQLPDTGVRKLPQLIWLAPDHALTGEAGKSAAWQPGTEGTVPIDTLDTFYIVFGRGGELVRKPAGSMVYLDETQGNRFVNHPDAPAACALLYDRQAFEQTGRDLEYLREALPLHINRYTGTIVPGNQRTMAP